MGTKYKCIIVDSKFVFVVLCDGSLKRRHTTPDNAHGALCAGPVLTYRTLVPAGFCEMIACRVATRIDTCA